jgi:hypothetical protein
VGFSPLVENCGDAIRIGLELLVIEDGRFDLLGLHTSLAVALSAVVLKQRLSQRWEDRPIAF